MYREAPEGANDATPGCDTQGEAADWACLIKDFLRPDQALLAEAPFIFARGNHEDCTPPKVGRGAEWFRYFATAPQQNNECFSLPQTRAEPVQINAGTLHFVLFDSSSASESSKPDKAQAAKYTRPSTARPSSTRSRGVFTATRYCATRAASGISPSTGSPGRHGRWTAL
ncbi:hypothetical protein [Actinomadura mexicana]|uniref:hypothetical protein n=1 Tax=Actinomadura mexicana TaxID=134959 RepID=UPI003CCBB5E4